jgi:hypothetical protein
MVNYKSIVEFFEEVALSEGRTDIQNHIGFMNIHNSTAKELAENAFGGVLLAAPKSDISECEKIIYVYISDDEYLDYATNHFSLMDERCFCVDDASGQRVLCWAIGV